MDITKSTNKISSNRYINGQSVNYSVIFLGVLFVFVALKQLLKGGLIGLSAPVAIIISFVAAMVLLFIGEKKYVFNHKPRNSTKKQLLFFVFRSAVDFGFYKIFEFAFVTMLDLPRILPYIFATVLIYAFNLYFDKLIIFDDAYDEAKCKNGRCYRVFFKNRYVLLSMLVVLCVFAVLYLVSSVYPFGDIMLYRIDLYHQYGPLFVEFYDRVTNLASFSYSWRTGGGSSFLGNYLNYLSSPLSFLVLLFDRDEVPYALTVIVVLKGMISAGTFTYFIRKSFNRHSLVSASFGIMYALSGYFLAYYWNIMWIEGMMLLPLIALGIEHIINKADGRLYIASMCLLFVSSYYMGYMCCLFAILYFILYYFCHYNLDTVVKPVGDEKQSIIKQIKNRKLLRAGARFATASLMCGVICACTLLPVFMILKSCSATSDSFPKSFESYYDLLRLVTSHLAGLEATIRSSGDDVLPNIYCGMLTLVLLPLYVLNRDIRLKEKAMYLLMLIFLVFSLDNKIMNFIWHAFHFPNDLPFRFSYMYSFILLIIAFRVLMNFRALEYRDIGMSGMLWIFMLLLIQREPTTKMQGATIYVSFAFVIVWTGVLYLLNKGQMKKAVIALTIIALTFSESLFSGVLSFVFTQDLTEYNQNYNEYCEAVNKIKSEDDGLYKTELTYLETRMDPCIYGYDGISVFSSMEYESYSQSQYSLGMFGNRINSFTYNPQTPVYNMMFNLKYLIEAKDTPTPSGKYYSEVAATKSGKTSIHENRLFLPIAFLASSELEFWDNSEGNPFEVQEDLIDRAAGVADVFVPVKYTGTYSGNNECDEVRENGTIFFTRDKDSSDTIDVTLESVRDGNMYVYVTAPDIESLNYYREDDSSTDYQNISEPYIKDLGYFNKGERITISLSLNEVEDEESYFEIYAYNVNDEALLSAYEMLSLGALDITNHNDTTIEGTINAGFDGYLYTSIPYDKAWRVYIDGQEAKTFSIGDANLCTTLKHGEHKIRLKYEPRGQRLGLAASAAGIVSLVAYEAVRSRRRKRISAEQQITG